nr:MAG TPA: hypothetical protein [Caudoviricetes sp.]
MTRIAKLPYGSIDFNYFALCEFTHLGESGRSETSFANKKVAIGVAIDTVISFFNMHNFLLSQPYLIRLTNKCAMAKIDAPISIPANMSIKLSLCSSSVILFFLMLFTPFSVHINHLGKHVACQCAGITNTNYEGVVLSGNPNNLFIRIGLEVLLKREINRLTPNINFHKPPLIKRLKLKMEVGFY